MSTPLLWADPPAALIQRIYRESRAAVRWYGSNDDPILSRQPWLRRVSAEFCRPLQAAGIYVEGLS